MGFFNQDNTRFETAWFSVCACLAGGCFPNATCKGKRIRVLAAKLVPVICLLLAYENIVLALSNVLSDNSVLVQIGRTTRAAVIPLFLVVMFEVAYAIHKRRSVKFCGIVFDQGHRRGVEPCSWVLRNFVRIVAILLFVVGILVNFAVAVGNDPKAGGTGLVDAQDASAHFLLALLPTTGMAAIALYIAVYMWKYGNDASMVVQSTVCNGWIFLFLGTLALLGGQVPSECCFRVVNESGQVLLLLSLIAIGREIGKEIQAADNFSCFLEKENELERGGVGRKGGGSATSASLRYHNPKVQRPQGPPAVTAALGESPATAVAESGRGAERELGEEGSSGARKQEEEESEEEEERSRERNSPDAVEWKRNEAAATSVSGDDEFEDGRRIPRGACGGVGGADQHVIDDVTRPMPRREARPTSSMSGEGWGRGIGGRAELSLPRILHQSKGPKLLEDGAEEAWSRR